jgi:hypothetical protein
MKRAGKCVHYNGTVNACCEAGVNYQALAGSGHGWAVRLPCFNAEYLSETGKLVLLPPVSTCDKRQEPTADELAADETWMAERMDRLGKIRVAIVAAIGGPWKRGDPVERGTIPCPCCEGGTVSYSRASYNGHIHAACSTPGCARWME